MKKYILTADTSTNSGSLSLFVLENEHLQLLNSSSWFKAKSHSEVITVECIKLFKNSKIEIHQLDALVTTIGPGSFTGIRVGLNFVKALAYSLDIPVFSFNTLQTLAYNHKDSDLPILVLNNAHKNMVYTAIYSAKDFSVLLEPCALTLKDLEKHLSDEHYLVVGDGFDLYKSHIAKSVFNKLTPENHSNTTNLSQTLGQLWFDQTKNTRPLSWNEVLPLYIRSSEAEERLWSGLLRPSN